MSLPILKSRFCEARSGVPKEYLVRRQRRERRASQTSAIRQHEPLLEPEVEAAAAVTPQLLELVFYDASRYFHTIVDNLLSSALLELITVVFGVLRFCCSAKFYLEQTTC